jgi:protein HOOK3
MLSTTFQGESRAFAADATRLEGLSKQLVEEKTLLEEKLAAGRERYQILDSEREKLEEELKQLEELNQELLDRNTKMEEEWSRANSTSESSAAEFREIESSLRAQLSDTEAERAKLSDELAKLTKEKSSSLASLESALAAATQETEQMKVRSCSDGVQLNAAC